MASNEEIVIEIGPNGDATVEGVNFSGPECKAFTRELEADLGEVTKVVEKPEMQRRQTRTTGRTASR